MEKISPSAGVTVRASYSERLTPSLWTLVAAAVVAPMATMVFVPFDTTVALIIGALAGLAVIAVLLAASPRIRVTEGVLYAGRAHIPVALLGTPEHFSGEEARQVRGPRLGARSWHLIRSGATGVVRIPVVDPDDPTTDWVLSSRTPDRLAAAIRRAQVRD